MGQAFVLRIVQLQKEKKAEEEEEKEKATEDKM